MPIRKVIRIDDDKCDGCGLCVPACAEGAIQIVNGKARLVSETYCDGLGNCLGECPQGAITIEEREAPAFDPDAVKRHLEDKKTEPGIQSLPVAPDSPQPFRGCPGAMARELRPNRAASEPVTSGSVPTSPQLGNWPIQLHLVPTYAPYFENARLLIAADCAPFAMPDFHSSMLAGRILLIGCPKLDDTERYLQKLTAIFSHNEILSVELAFMEVPCCYGLVRLVQIALKDSGKDIPLSLVKIGIRGEVLETIRAEGMTA
ncbi:MAG: 4Fe-4S binding protein [Candidatus Zixiibacteriota bacterium]|nr:MAG: 4Fe-4S binding protein [candidate division Zixibacteria bacterium]